MSEDSKNCWQCRIISGGVLFAAGTYVVHHGKKFKGFQRLALTSIGCGFGLLGSLRLFNLPPFRSKKFDEKSSTGKKEEDEILIENLSSKLN